MGDDRQLPPTSFFERMAQGDDEEESQTADLESVLGLFSAKGAPQRMLKWHYRSLHESLITVSNHEFYHDDLVVFPGPDKGKEETGLIYRQDPDAFYDGRGRNKAEAKAVADAVMEHARRTPELSLGVATFSLNQARLIEDLVERMRRSDIATEAFFAEHPEEPFFVKNLENVQGDERDVILISVTYGWTDTAKGKPKLPMRFGPLNNDGGERRLNVLITRAKRRCEVYSNFEAADLDLRRSKARGVKALKTFLDYAQTGIVEGSEAAGVGHDSPFEEAVADLLNRRGHDVVAQVGSAGFRIDLAVVDPDKPGRYLLGIECDGASYHSARSARDRDRLRQQVLEGRGWTIHRIWSTDWFHDHARELIKVEIAIKRAKAKRDMPSAPAAPKIPDPIIRTEKPPSDLAVPVSFYELAELSIDPRSGSLSEVASYKLAELVRRVVEVEAPVHVQEALGRIRTAWGIQRAGAEIRRRMNRAVSWGAERRWFRKDIEGFLWLEGPGIAVRVRRRNETMPRSLRDPARIAREEIATALVAEVRESFGIEEEEALTRTARLFGFKHRGPKITERFRDVLDGLLEKGGLIQEEPYLRIPHENQS